MGARSARPERVGLANQGTHQGGPYTPEMMNTTLQLTPDRPLAHGSLIFLAVPGNALGTIRCDEAHPGSTYDESKLSLGNDETTQRSSGTVVADVMATYWAPDSTITHAHAHTSRPTTSNLGTLTKNERTMGMRC